MKNKIFRAERPSKVRSWCGLLLLSALILFNRPVQAAPLKDLIQYTRRLLGDTPYYASIPKITDAKIAAFLNEGQHFAGAYSWAFTKRQGLTLVAGTTEYALPSDYIAVRRVTLDNAIIAERTLEALDDEGAKWVETTGRPQFYYTRTTTSTVIGFTPTPDANNQGDVQIDYIAQIQDMTSLGDLPFNGVIEYQGLDEALCKFAAYRFFLLTGNDKMADIYAKEYASDVKRIGEIQNSKPNYRPGFQPNRQ